MVDHEPQCRILAQRFRLAEAAGDDELATLLLRIIMAVVLFNCKATRSEYESFQNR